MKRARASKGEPERKKVKPLKDSNETNLDEQVSIETQSKSETKGSGHSETKSDNETPVDIKSKEKAEKEPETKENEVKVTEKKPEKTETKDGENKDFKDSKKLSGFSSFSNSSFGKCGGFSSFSSFGKDKSAFGSFGSFGSGFSKLHTNSTAENPWAEKVSGKEKEEPEESAEHESLDTYAQLMLEKQDIKTGEEDEITIHSLRTRLYAVDNKGEKKVWKERGTGILKLNRSSQSEMFRLVMRLDGVLRVALNLPLFKNMQLAQGFTNSLHTERFVRFSGIEEGQSRQFAVRCASEEARDQLFEELEKAIKRLN